MIWRENQTLIHTENLESAAQAGWQRALAPILWGLALSTVTPRFQGLRLETLLPLAGTLLLLQGFRGLRRQNRFFLAGWLFSILCTAQVFCQMLFLASHALQDWGYSLWLFVPGLLASLARMVCLWQGLNLVQTQAGLPKTGAAGWLAAWYLLMYLLALTRYRGILVWAMLIAFVALLVRLNRSAKQLDQAGHPFFPAPARLPGWLLSLLLAGSLAVGIGILLRYGARYPMEWQPLDRQEGGPQLQQTKQELLELGFPAQILDDLEPQQILDCQGALQVEMQQTSYDVNPKSQDLLFTHIAVLLPGEQQHWKVFHHFLWQTDPGFPGTESIRLWPASRLDGWQDQGNFQGRLLWETDEGQTMTGDFHSQGIEEVRNQSPFWDNTTQDWIATFSLPKEGRSCRGYLCYDILALQEGWMIDSWVNYTHQKHWQYPAMTSKEHQMQAGFLREDNFVTAQTALQFHTAEIDGEYRVNTQNRADSSLQG